MNYNIAPTTLDKFIQIEGDFDSKGNYVKFSSLNITQTDKKIILNSFANPTKGMRYKKILSTDGYWLREKLIYVKGRISIKTANGQKAFHNSFNEFLLWWLDKSHYSKNEGQVCYYCGSTQVDWNKIIKKRKNNTRKHMGFPKKGNKNGGPWDYPNMEIDRLNPNDPYEKRNCVLACHLCNNTKSDLIEAYDYKKHFGLATKTYIDYIK